MVRRLNYVLSSKKEYGIIFHRVIISDFNLLYLPHFFVFVCFLVTGFYVDGFPKLNRFIEHHDKIMGKFLPKLKRKLDKCGCDSILYALKWFFVVFQERVINTLIIKIT